jgi:hypothetical protein
MDGADARLLAWLARLREAETEALYLLPRLCADAPSPPVVNAALLKTAELFCAGYATPYKRLRRTRTHPRGNGRMGQAERPAGACAAGAAGMCAVLWPRAEP